MRRLLLIMAVLAVTLNVSAHVRLEIEASPSTAGAARRIEAIDPARYAPLMEMIGLEDAGEPIRVLVMPEQSPTARATPRWISGFADGYQSVVVVFPARASTYPDDGLEQLIRHEVAHILIARAAGGQPVPRWFHEGVAVMAGRPWGLEDRGRVMIAAISSRPISLERLERDFRSGEAAASRAYALSAAFVRDLMQRHGANTPARILEKMREGRSFDEAFAAALGRDLRVAEKEFWQRQTIWNRWIPLATSSLVLWIGITLLAIWAFRRRRQRDAAILDAWADEEIPPPRAEPKEWIH
ncbi:MAG TPA: hypothetical protein VM534_02670 [Thermoanaerobaculia bacterium]|nr:hypothetical protein [Thermoanaerobaculia bacterium]